MKGYVQNLLAEKQPWVEVIKILQQNNHRAYLVGGCVRDMLLGISTKDADIATSAEPDHVERLFNQTIPVGKAFGVIIVLHKGEQMEVATFRKDGSYSDGRHPSSISFSHEKEDASRRDFTINAMYLDPVQGRIYDPVKGRKDLAARLIRAVGDPAQRFQEDKLRVLRAVRFHARLGFRIASSTLQAMGAVANDLGGVSVERIRSELSMMLTQGNPYLAFTTLDKAGLLDTVLGDVASLRNQSPLFGSRRPSALHETLLTMQWLKPDQETVAWSLLLAQSGRRLGALDPAETFNASSRYALDILRALNSSKQLAEEVSAVLKNLVVCANSKSLPAATVKKMLMAPEAAKTLETFRIICLAWQPKWLEQWQKLSVEHWALLEHPFHLSDWITGGELAELGFKQGPMVGVIMRKVEDKVLNRELNTKIEVKEYIENEFGDKRTT